MDWYQGTVVRKGEVTGECYGALVSFLGGGGLWRNVNLDSGTGLMIDGWNRPDLTEDALDAPEVLAKMGALVLAKFGEKPQWVRNWKTFGPFFDVSDD